MEFIKQPIQDLIDNYGKTSDEKIKKLLGRIKIVKDMHHGLGTMYGYHEMHRGVLQDFIEKPRAKAITYVGNEDYQNGHLMYLKKFADLLVYNRSMSHMLMKLDIGEILDAIPLDVIDKVDAINVNINGCDIIDVDRKGLNNISESDFFVVVELLRYEKP